MRGEFDYWELTEEERAALTEDQLTSYTNYELMKAGLVRPTPEPELLEVPPVLEKAPLYRPRVGGRYGNKLDIAFQTEVQAKGFLSLNPIPLGHQYVGSEYLYYPEANEVTVEIENFPTAQAVVAQKAQIERFNSAKAENDRRKREWTESKAKADKALQGLWDDWRRCQALVYKLQRIRDTFAEYVRMAKGNKATARDFLEKTFPDLDEVKKAIGDQGREPRCEPAVEESVS